MYLNLQPYTTHTRKPWLTTLCPPVSRSDLSSLELWEWRGLDAGAVALKGPNRDRPAERTAQPLHLHHAQILVVILDGHAALVKVEQHADAVALLRRALHPLPVV